MNEAFTTGLQLSVLGMGLVFILLALLWALMVLMVRFDRTEPEPALPQPVTASPASELDPALRAAILAAVLRYRHTRQPAEAPTAPATGHWVEIGRARQHDSNRARRRG